MSEFVFRDFNKNAYYVIEKILVKEKKLNEKVGGQLFKEELKGTTS